MFYRTIFLFTILISLFTSSISAQNFEPQSLLDEIVEAHEQTIGLENYLEQEKLKIQKLDSILNGKIADTIFNINQIRLYEFLKDFVGTQPNLPLTTISPEALAEYASAHMYSLEAERQTADEIYKHVKHQAMGWLKPSFVGSNSQVLLEGIELLGRGTRRAVLELGASDVESLTNHMDDVKIQKILKGLAKIQRKAVEMEFTKLTATNEPLWLQNRSAELSSELINSYELLMKPIDKKNLANYHGHLKALVNFQTSYSKLIGLSFEWYLNNGLQLTDEIAINNQQPIKDLQERWKKIKAINSTKFNNAVKTEADEALNWLQTSLKEDYFEYRLLLRDLGAIKDINNKVTVLSKAKIKEAMVDLSEKWNTELLQNLMAIDTTRESLISYVELGIPKKASSLMVDQLLRIDAVIQDKLLEEMNWTKGQLDSLLPSNEETESLVQLLDKTQLFLNQVSILSQAPKLNFTRLTGKFELRAAWEGNSVRYELYEIFKISDSQNSETLSRLIPTGIQTPWISIDQKIWKKSVAEFETEWAGIVSLMQLEVNQEFENWLKGHGFPGTLPDNFTNAILTEEVTFEWLDKKWTLSLEESPTKVIGDTIKFGIDELSDSKFWTQQIEHIAAEKWSEASKTLEKDVIVYLNALLPETTIKLPNDLKGYLRGESIVYTFDLSQLGNTSLTGATVTFKTSKKGWNTSYKIPHTIILDHLSYLLPHLIFHDTSYVNSKLKSKISLKLGINDPIYIGDFSIDDRGRISTNALNTTNIELKLGSEFHIKLIGLKYSDYKFSWSNVIFQKVPSHLEDIQSLSGDFGLSIQFLPQLAITFDDSQGNRDRLYDILNAALNSRGLLPPGVIIDDIRINENGIYPHFAIHKDLQTALKEQVKELCDSLEKIPIQIANDPQFIEMGKSIESIYNLAQSWELNKNIDTIKLLARVLENPQDIASILALVQMLNNDDQIVFENGLIIEIDGNEDEIKEIEFIVKGFGCDDKSILSIEIENKRLIPDLGNCFEDFITGYFDQPIIDDDHWKLEFQIEQMRLVLSDFTDIPLEMYLGLDGRISWNFSAEEIAEALLDSYAATAEEIAKEQLEDLTLEVTNNLVAVADELLDQWNTLLTGLGFKIENKPQLEQKLKSAKTPQELTKMRLNATLLATTGILAGNKIENVGLQVSKGLTPDFSKAIINLKPVKSKINNWGKNYIEVENDLLLKNGIITGRLLLKIPDFDAIPIALKINLSEKKLETSDWEELLLLQVNHVINTKILPYEVNNSDVSLAIVSAKASKSELIFKCIFSISTDSGFDIPIHASLKIDFSNGEVKIFPEKDLKTLFAGAAGQLLKFISLPLLEENEWLKEVSFYPSTGIPSGIKIVGEAPLWGMAKIEIPGLIISNNGVRFADDAGLKINFGGAVVPVPPCFQLIEPTGEIKESNLAFSAKLTFNSPQTERLIYAKGTFSVNLKEPLKWETRTDLVALQVFNIGYSKQTIDLEEGIYEMQLDFGGPVKDIIAIQGQGKITAKGPKVNANGKLHIFSEPMASGDFKLDLSKQTVVANSKIDIPVTGSIESYFSTASKFSDPTIAASKNFEILGLKLSGTRFLISENMASAQFSVLGLAMNLQVPGYKQLTKDAFKELLENLLSPDFDNIDEALLALLSGNITINPFSGFGPGGGGIGGDGGDGGSQGTSGNNGNTGYENASGANSKSATSTAEGASAGGIQSKVAGTQAALKTPEKSIVGDGKTPALIHGNYSFPVKKEGSFYRALQVHAQKPEESKAMSYISPEYIASHFTQSGDEYLSNGLFLIATKRYYSHILKQKVNGSACGDQHGVIHWYSGEKGDQVIHLEMPLEELGSLIGNLCYNDLPQRIKTDPLLGHWLQSFSQTVGNKAIELNSKKLIAEAEGSIFKLKSNSDTYAVAVRFFNSLDHVLIIATKDNAQMITVPEIQLIRNKPQAQLNLLELVQKHNGTSIGLYEKNGTLYLYTGCDPKLKSRYTYKLQGSAFVIDESKTTSCDPKPEPIDPEPKPIKKTPSVSVPGFELLGPGNCNVALKNTNNIISFHCSPNPQAFAHSPLKYGSDNLFELKGSSWVPSVNTLVWELHHGLIRYVFKPNNPDASILWIQGNNMFNISKLPLGKGTPTWEQLKPEAYEQNKALHGAFAELSEIVTQMIYSGYTLENSTLEYFNEDGIAAFLVQFKGRPKSEYYVCMANSESQKQLTKRFSSGGGSPTLIPNFKKHLRSISQ